MVKGIRSGGLEVRPRGGGGEGGGMGCRRGQSEQKSITTVHCIPLSGGSSAGTYSLVAVLKACLKLRCLVDSLAF